MNLLIDTQSFIWFVEANDKLPDKMRARMVATNGLTVSIASFWEITIKMSLDKLHLSGNIETMMNKAVTAGFEILPIEQAHLVTLSTLDFFHKDPFDRIIIAQAIAEDMPLVSSDSVFELYEKNGLQWIW
jgi:PIN domain nuclease of toxin-antitoxin system